MKLFVASAIALLTLFACSTSKELSSKGVAINEKQMEGTWLLKNGVHDSVLVFNRLLENDSTKFMTKKLDIGQGKMTFSLHNPQPMCGNGSLYLEKVSYLVQDKIVDIRWKGGYRIESTFDNHYQYKMSNQSENSFTLVKIKTHSTDKKAYKPTQINAKGVEKATM